VNKLLSFFSIALLLVSFSTASYAINKDQAKAQGLIGETSQGYLASVKGSPSAEISALINSINQARKAAYAKSAANAGVGVDVVAKRVAQRQVERAASGAFIRNAAGNWYQK